MTGAPAASSAAARRDAIERLATAVPPLLVIADFDGTLAVGARDSTVAHIEPAAQRALRALVRLGSSRVVVTVLTGRTVADVATRVRVGGVEYLGDHGLQHGRLPRGGRAERLVVATEPGWEAHRDAAEALATGVAAALGHPSWLYVERKGPSVAFHVRQADDVATARAAVLDAIATVEARDGLRDHGLRHYRGRSVVDLRPEDAGGKREAVERLIERHRPGAIVALGDELSDVDAFEAVRAAVSAVSGAGGVVGVTVAVHGSTKAAPAELLAVADLQLTSAEAVGPFLAGLERRVSRGGSAG